MLRQGGLGPPRPGATLGLVVSALPPAAPTAVRDVSFLKKCVDQLARVVDVLNSDSNGTESRILLDFCKESMSMFGEHSTAVSAVVTCVSSIHIRRAAARAPCACGTPAAEAATCRGRFVVIFS